jgi:uncharacterized protein (DUF58 family)
VSRASFLGLLLLVALVGGLITLRGSGLALAIPIVLYWAYALWRTPDDLNLQVNRELSSDRVGPQVPVEIRVTIVNAGPSLDELAIQDLVPAGLEILDGSNRHLLSLKRGGTFDFKYKARGDRGGYWFRTLHAEAGDSLGLLRLAVDVSTSSRLVVLPTFAGVRGVPIRPRRTRVYAGMIPARVGGAGVEFFGVRQYEIGDSARHINWRAPARHAEGVFSNEFQQERVADVALVLDGRIRADVRASGTSLFEHSVAAAGSLAGALLHQGNRVGLLVYSQYLQWTLPGYGKIQRERILEALALAAPGGSQVFEGLQYLPTRLFPPESQIVLVSPLLEDDLPTLIQLRARGYHVLVVCPDPVEFEMSDLPRRGAKYSRAEARLAGRIVKLERAVALGRLRRAGVHVIEWDVSRPFDQAMRGAFRRVAALRA